MIEFLRIKETCLYFHDLNIAKAFYHEKLGLPVISQVDNKHLFLRAGSSVLLIFNPEDSKYKVSPPAHYGSGKLHFAFEVPDEYYETAKMEIVKRGISITDEVQWKTGKKSFYFNDPQGNVVEILPEKGIWD
jgi:catechol 2,3-dioxygenase-like lactoylglutathione lyase family enzyme